MVFCCLSFLLAVSEQTRGLQAQLCSGSGLELCHGLSPAHFKSAVTCMSCWPPAVLLQAHRHMAKGRMSALQEGAEHTDHWTFHTMPQWVALGFTWSTSCTGLVLWAGVLSSQTSLMPPQLGSGSDGGHQEPVLGCTGGTPQPSRRSCLALAWLPSIF